MRKPARNLSHAMSTREHLPGPPVSPDAAADIPDALIVQHEQPSRGLWGCCTSRPSRQEVSFGDPMLARVWSRRAETGCYV